MPSRKMTPAEVQQTLDAVTQAQAEGYKMSGRPSLYKRAAELIGISSDTLRKRLQSAIPLNHAAAGSNTTAPFVAPPVGTPTEPADPIELRRLKDQLTQYRNALEKAERRTSEAEDIRAGVLGLLSEPLKPRFSIPKPGDGRGDRRSVIAHLTDVHLGETVSSAEMDGCNSYNVEIAKRRIGRFFDKIADLCTKHWVGAPPEEIVLCLGGDLISGQIHAELLETNFPAVPGTVKLAGELIAGGIVVLRQRVKCPVRVYTVPGNHGRLTFKPQSKGRAATSLDLLVSDFAEACVRGAGVTDVTFYQTASPDAYFSTYGFHWLLNHGDTTGSRGGQGFIGAGATIIRGHRKLMDTSLRQGRMVHYVMTGHLHTTLRTPFGYSGGSVVGYSEYSRDGRMDPEPAKQNMLVVHEGHGVINHIELHLGTPDEGSHYLGPATVIRPAMVD